MAICALITLPGYAIPESFSSFVRQQTNLLLSSFDYVARLASQNLHHLIPLRSKDPQLQPRSLAERLAMVSSIIPNPARRVAYVGDHVPLTAVGMDSAPTASVIPGLKFTWSTLDPNLVLVDEAGRVTCLAPGLARVVCAAGSLSATVLILIRPATRPVETDSQWNSDQDNPKDNWTSNTGTAFQYHDSGNTPAHGILAAYSVLPRVEDKVGRIAGSFDMVTRPAGSLINRLVPVAMAQSGGPSTNSQFLIGLPRNGVVEQTRFGAVLPENADFELAIPIAASTGGRMLDVPLTLYYNSRIWSQTGPTTMYFDPNQSWPCPGYSMGFGRIDSVLLPDGVTAQYTLVEPNGTSHYLGQGAASVTGTPPPYPTYTTSDGTYIAYIGDAVHGGELYYPNGEKFDISLVNNRLLTTQVTEPNGNYYQISYEQNLSVYSPFAINYIVDTLGRNISFNYDTSSGKGLLTSVTGPSGGATFAYTQKNLTYNFYSTLFGQQMTVQNAPSNYQALTQINAQNLYQMSYSDYGMVYSFTMGRTNTATVTFDYTTSGTTQLTGAPAFTQRTEKTGTVQGTYSYSQNGNVVTISRPDGTTLNLTDSGTGLLAQTEIKKGATSYGKIVNTYSADPGGAQELTTMLSYDDTGNPIRTDFSYDQYANVLSRSEYGYKVGGTWQLQRKVVLAYQGVPYTTNHMLRLEDSYSVYDGNNHQQSQTQYSYDGYGSLQNYAGTANPPGHLSSYDNTYTMRGNVTTVTQTTNISTGASVSRSVQYDIFGNEVEIDLDCCHQNTFSFTSATYWSQPDQTTTGSGTGSLTTNSSYNFSTSGLVSRTDPNGLTTQYSRDSWLNPTQIVPPSGGTFTVGYGDWGDLDSNSVSYSDGGVNKSFSASETKDGWGNPIQQFDAAGNQINLVYDSMGRLSSKTNPFPHNGTPGPSTSYLYDALGRCTKATLPNNQSVQYSYSGTTFTLTDQVGHKKQQQKDGLGRLITVTEQDPMTGNLTLTTTYSYDFLDDLTQVNQGGQIRSFKYDSIGRKLFERIPEQTATINDGTGTLWSSAYTYTSFGAVATKTDARGVVITYSYDGMNRLTSISYNTTSAPGVASTPNVTLTYDTSSSSTTKGLLLSATIAGLYSEAYGYDSSNRLNAITATIDGRNYTTSYVLNQVGQLSQITYPSTRVVPYAYDSFARLSSIGVTVSKPSGYVNTIAYNNADQMTALNLGNGVAQTFSYDSQTLQLTGQTALKGATSLMNLTYSYAATAGQLGAASSAGNAGQIVSLSGSINGITESALFSYDDLSRLVSSSQTSNSSSAQRRFSYDRWGNRGGVWDAISGGTQIQSVTLQQSGGVPTNQVQSVTGGGTFVYLYDAAGNVTSDGIHSYTYDAEDHLVSVDSGSTAQYAYGFGGHRIKKVISSATTHYVWHGDEVLAEHDGTSGAVLVDYIINGDTFVAKETGGGTAYFVRDRISERLNLDQNGTVTGQGGHLPFGEQFADSGSIEKHVFTTYEQDTETVNNYAINRFSSTSMARFLSADPYQESAFKINPQSWNRYTYTQNDPVNSSDPTGLYLRVTPPPPAPSMPLPPSTWWPSHESGGLPALIGNGVGPEPTKPVGLNCEDLLSSLLKVDMGPNQAALPTADQLAVAQQISSLTGAPDELILATWYIESRFGGQGTSNNFSTSTPAYGPGQITVAIAQQWGAGVASIDQIVGDQSSSTFTGDPNTNLLVMGFFLNYLYQATTTNGTPNDALAGAAYLGQNQVIGKDPKQLTGGYKTRYNQYQKLLVDFTLFNKCKSGQL